MKRIPIKVTDHAAMRYLQRVMGVDLDAVKQIVAEQVHIAETNNGATAVLSNGFRYVIRNGHVITVLDQNSANPINKTRAKDHRE